MFDPTAETDPNVRSDASDPSSMTAIEARLAELIRRSARGCPPDLAETVLRHIEALCQHPELRDPAQFCAYRRLARHWRWLAAHGGQSPARTWVTH